MSKKYGSEKLKIDLLKQVMIKIVYVFFVRNSYMDLYLVAISVKILWILEVNYFRYVALQVMSKSCACKFLYGTDTNRDEIGKLDNALDTQTEFKTEIIFYRKHGKETFIIKIWNTQTL